MPKLNFTPLTVLLTSGQAATSEATNGANAPVSVSWSLNPPTGSSATPAADTEAPSATYVAPQLVADAQTIAVIASRPNDSAGATISVTPAAIAVVPAKVDLIAAWRWIHSHPSPICGTSDTKPFNRSWSRASRRS